MRTRLSVRIPAETEPSQLRAVASLASVIASGRWGYLAESFGRMDGAGVRISPSMAALLDDLSDGLRSAAEERAEVTAPL
jgi:hypothetical protein